MPRGLDPVAWFIAHFTLLLGQHWTKQQMLSVATTVIIMITAVIALKQKYISI